MVVVVLSELAHTVGFFLISQLELLHANCLINNVGQKKKGGGGE